MNKDKQQDYLESLGLLCPVCRSDKVVTKGPLEQDAGVAWQNVSCDNCSHIWVDQYTLTGFSELEPE